MSTAIGMDTCPRCGNFTLFTDLDTRTGDYDAYCQKCGCGYHFNYKRDENYNIITKDIVYPRNKIYFVVTDFDKETILWKKPMNEVKDLTAEMIVAYINHVYFGDTMKDNPYGLHAVYVEEDGEMRLAYHLGDTFRIDNPETVTLVQAQSEESETVGYGLINIEVPSSYDMHFEIPKGMTKSDAQKKLHDMLNIHKKDDIKSVTATWFNEETNTLEELE